MSAVVERVDLEQLFDRRNHLRSLNGLGDVGVGPELERALPVLLRPLRRDDDDGRVFVHRIAGA